MSSRISKKFRFVLLVALALFVAVLLLLYSINREKTPNKQLPTANKETCEEFLVVEKQKSQLYFRDSRNMFSLDVSSLPEFHRDPFDYCVDTYYEVELYTNRENGGSVARLGVRVENYNHSSLEEYAKKELAYVEGTHIDSREGAYKIPYTSSALISGKTRNGFSYVSWTDIYTTEETRHEGATAQKHYVLLSKNTIFSFSITAWDIPSFEKVIKDFDIAFDSFSLQ